MLTEITKTRQIPGEPLRRWFSSQEQDLYVWQDQAGKIVAFQLCYAKHRNEHAIYWRQEAGFAHLSVDDGESTALASATPILLADGTFRRNAVIERFRSLAVQLPNEIVQIVIARLLEFPSGLANE